MSVSKQHLGIDLGTTNSVAARADASGEPRAVVNFEGDVLTPSALLFEDDATILVGREAVKRAEARPDAFVECFKRDVGSEQMSRPVAGQLFRPEFLSAVLLKRLKADFERALGDARDVVVTVPAFFDEARRRATRNAGLIAGWNVRDIINEPTAAALAYAHARAAAGDGRRNILVYDLGGGTFDCTLLELQPGRVYRTIATDGDVLLGGVDWDERLCRHIAAQFEKKTGVAPLAGAAGKAQFLRLARQLKHALSARPSADVPAAFDGKRAILAVRRDEFEGMTSDLLDRTRTTARMMLEAAGKTWKEIDSVIAVGGSSRMPMVGAMLEKESGRKPDMTASLDEAVAFGAAVYAHLLESGNAARIVNVNSHSLRLVGRKRDRQVAYEMIPRNRPLPAEKTQIFPVATPGQRSVQITICEGEIDDPELCESIGRVLVDDLPESTDTAWKVAVTLRYETDGTVGVSATVHDPADMSRSVKRVSTTLVPSRGLDARQIEEEKRRLDTFRIA